MVPDLQSPQKPSSSPPERPGVDNNTSHPWSDATCPCNTSSSAYFCFVTLFLFEKTRQSTREDRDLANSLYVGGSGGFRNWNDYY